MNASTLFVFLLIIGIFIALDFFLWRALNKTIASPYFKFLRWILPLSSLLFFFSLFLKFYRFSNAFYNATSIGNFCFGTALGFLIAKIVATLVFLLEDAYRGSKWVYQKWNKKKRKQNSTTLTGRRNFIRNISLGLASLPFFSTIYAITKGKYSFHRKRVDLFFNRLPPSFNGLRIVQFSDFHAGSFDDYEKVKEGLSLINEEKPDLIFFTGDLVNNRSIEAKPYLDLLKSLQAKYGKYAILGNHDYGDYLPFKNEEEKIKNKILLEDIFKETGFQLLQNENRQIFNGKDSLDIIGVENWGSGRFPKYGDINKAIQGTKENQFNLFLSHDPDHWEYKIRQHPKHIDLTLSGHTHGAQFGVKIPGWKWSPIQYRYKRWLGLYQENNQYLFVSKGFGFLGFPGRIGMLPEIVSINLYNKEA